ncbi:DUF4868 domain-containing protein [Paenibacillus dokdonensis]|uniref:DUF4868 domain-containing protein n=1 Tax=Paenibacillus dokdonensis TaxID=2567944 RepID=A0ABU6GUH2_9BACL|nr:Kiwa anti-phage protein KwaB-like domain-containing protein [Paenibacillus dokdonensis]MEC0242787.1 DUF4868 domain-containing protein [Paenibacillus dokdonensis]
MNIRDVVGLLGNGAKDVDVRLYFVRKHTNDKYTSYSPTISLKLQNELLDIVKKAMGQVTDVEQREFNPIGSIDGCIEYCKVDKVANFNDILLSTQEDVVVRRPIEAEEIKKLTFYLLKVNIGDNNELLFFRRLTKFNRLSKGGLVGFFQGDDFQKLETDLLGIDPSIDIAVFQEEMLVLNHVALERIFSVQDQYSEKATHTLKIVGQANRIRNFDQFQEDCLNDRRIIRALTKLLDEEERITKCFNENFDNIIQVVDIFELDINFEEGNSALIYENKSQLLDITRLIRDSFYRSLINNREGIDEGV